MPGPRAGHDGLMVREDADQLRPRAARAIRRRPSSETILRTCVHCGFCTATCPTYLLLGDELDTPRGRIYLIKEMLERGKPATPEIVKHIDRCLSCLACMTTCPSGVHYMHLVDHARAYIEETYRRPWHDRVMRTLLAKVLPYPGRFRLALSAASLGRPFAGLLGALPRVGNRLRAMLALAPARAARPLALCAAGRLAGARAATRTGRDPVGLRPAGAEPELQRGRDPAPQPPRRRGRAAEGGGVLRRACPPHGPRARGARLRAAEHRRLDGRDRGRGARRHRDHRVGLRHHRQGLRLHVPQRPGLRRKGARGCRRSQRTSPNIWRASG